MSLKFKSSIVQLLEFTCTVDTFGKNDSLLLKRPHNKGDRSEVALIKICLYKNKILLHSTTSCTHQKTAKKYLLFFLVYFWAGVILLVCFCFSGKFLHPLDSPCILCEHEYMEFWQVICLFVQTLLLL